MSSAAPLQPPPSVWLYGRGIDLLFGYGLAYLFCVPLLLALPASVAASNSLIWVPGLVALATTTPHYGATLMRVYEGRDERRKYAFFALWLTAGLAILFVGALYDRFLGSVLLTLYASWSPWHFSGQNYGLAAMYLRRSGVEFTPGLKRPLYLSFVLSAVLAFLALHISDSGLNFAQDATDASGTFGMLQLGIPSGLGMALASAVLLVYLGSLILFVARLRPSLALFAPVALLIATQALWFTVPTVFVALLGRDIQGLLPFTAVALSAAHSTQYLWVSSYYARREGAARKPLPFFFRCLLAGAAISAPTLLFAPGLLGGAVPNGAGILVLAFSVVNLHHFVLDGAIWKLRDGRVARALLQASGGGDVGPRDDGGVRHWLRPALIGLGVITLLVKIQIIGLGASTHEDTETQLLQSNAAQLAFLGRDTSQLWGWLGGRLESEGQFEPAIEAYRRSVQRGARVPWVVNRLAWLLLNQHGSDPASVEEATELGRYLTEQLGTTRAEGLQTLAAAHAAAGRHQLAVRASAQAAVVARANGESERASYIDQQTARYRALAARTQRNAGAIAPTPSNEAPRP